MEASYGKEPFDLRLLLLRLGRNLWKILALTILGTVLFGGGYYVKNVLLQPDPGYAASSTYKVEYVENPNAAGAYYINEATWNSLLHTGEFLDGVETHLQEAAERGETGAAAVLEQGRDRWIEALSAALPSDFSIPVTKATTQDPGESIALAHAAEETMCGEFAESMPEITRIKVLDHGDLAEAVVPDVRPVRAVILAAVLSLFFVVVIFLLWELSRDSIWLPATLRRRYGLHSLGTVESTGFAENVKYLLEKADAHKIAVCRRQIHRRPWTDCASCRPPVESRPAAECSPSTENGSQFPVRCYALRAQRRCGRRMWSCWQCRPERRWVNAWRLCWNI